MKRVIAFLMISTIFVACAKDTVGLEKFKPNKHNSEQVPCNTYTPPPPDTVNVLFTMFNGTGTAPTYFYTFYLKFDHPINNPGKITWDWNLIDSLQPAKHFVDSFDVQSTVLEQYVITTKTFTPMFSTWTILYPKILALRAPGYVFKLPNGTYLQ